jgi:hypothetical protein
MPSLGKHQNTQLVKGLLVGDPGSGKTGGLTSLVAAGYKLRIADFDNLLGSLVSFVQKECPDKIDNVTYQTFTDKMAGTAIPLQMIGQSMKVNPNIVGVPKAYPDFLKQLNHWKTEDEDLGKPESWGPECIFVLDSLTACSSAAFRYAQGMNPSAKEGQTYFYAAQQLITNLLSLLASKDFATNVLVLAHLDYREQQPGMFKGFPRAVGQALHTQIGAYFNCVLMAESQGRSKVIRTMTNGVVDLKNPLAHKLPDTLPLETGLATFFKEVTSTSQQ